MKRLQSGISYVEVLVATVLITTMLVPALEALKPGIQGSAIHTENAEVHYALVGKLEEVLAESFDNLEAAATTAGAPTNPTTYSDDINEPIPRNVFVWRYDIDDADSDGDVFTDGEADLLWVRVELANDTTQALETLISPY